MDTTRLYRLGGMPLLRADVLPTFVLGLVIILASGKAAEDQLPTRPLDAAAYAILVLAAATVPLRRHVPLAMLGAATVIVGIYLAVGYPHGPIIIVLVVAAYTVAARHPVRRAATAVAPAAVLFTVASDLGGQQLLAGAGGDWLDWLALVAKSGFVLIPACIGVLVQRSRTYAERADEEATRRKVEQERLRVAREVHDVVGHSLSIISLQAGVALHVLDRRPEQAQVALEAIRRTSLDALDELRATLTLTRAGLRSVSPGVGSPDAVSTSAVSTGDARSGSAPLDRSPASRSPASRSSAGSDFDRAELGSANGKHKSIKSDIPDTARPAGTAGQAGTAGKAAAARVPLTGLARLDGLLGEVRLCGVPVELMTTGTPRALPADVDLAVYRVIQESLTNVMRHAAPARARISLGYAADRFTVEVVDEPVAVRQSSSDVSEHRSILRGHGLAGLAERLGELGGSLTAGPQPRSAADTTKGDDDGTNGRRPVGVGNVAGIGSMAGNGNVAGNGNRADNGGAGWRVHAELPLREVGT